jgi:predicted Zn-dependent protease
MGLIYSLGRSLGHATIPAIRKSKWVWRTLVGNEEEAVQSEREFGRALAAELRLKSGVSQDGAIAALVRDPLQQLIPRIRNKQRTFTAEVLLEETPTALALPGGFIFVSSGMLDFCQRAPDEIAFILAHEMGHVVRGHSLDRMLRRIGAEGLSAILSRGLINPTLRETSLRWLESSHSHEQEFEADEFGVRLCVAAGYDGTAALRLFERLAHARKDSAGSFTYLTTHPPEGERVAQVIAVLRTVSNQAPASGNQPPPGA